MIWTLRFTLVPCPSNRLSIDAFPIGLLQDYIFGFDLGVWLHNSSLKLLFSFLSRMIYLNFDFNIITRNLYIRPNQINIQIIHFLFLSKSIPLNNNKI